MKMAWTGKNIYLQTLNLFLKWHKCIVLKLTDGNCLLLIQIEKLSIISQLIRIDNINIFIHMYKFISANHPVPVFWFKAWAGDGGCHISFHNIWFWLLWTSDQKADCQRAERIEKNENYEIESSFSVHLEEENQSWLGVNR